MDWWLLSFFLGALLSLFLPDVPSQIYLILLTVISLVCVYFVKTRKLAAFLLGSCWMLFHAVSYQNIWLDNAIDINELQSSKSLVVGEITSIPSLKGQYQRFNLSISQLNGTTLKREFNARISWKNEKVSLRQGQQWQFRLGLKKAHGLANQAGFSYQSWLRQNHLHATGYVVRSKKNKLLNASTSLRDKTYRRFQEKLPEHDLSPILTALAFGERHQLTDKHWQVFTDTATQHLIAISGLHLGLMATISFFVLSKIIQLIPISLIFNRSAQQQLLNKNRVVFTVVFTLIITLAYAYLAGFSTPTIRALLMLMIFWLAKLYSVKLSLSRWLLLTVFCITLISPFSLFSMSFWLSLYAVSIIFLLLWRLKQRSEEGNNHKLKDKVITLLYLQFALVSLMWPLTIGMQYQLSLTAFFANLIAVPWISLISLPLVLLALLASLLIPDYCQLFFTLALNSFELIWLWLDWLATLDLSSIAMSQTSWMLISFFVFASLGVWLFANKLQYLKLQFVIICLTLFSYVLSENFMHDKLHWQVRVMDIGQGLSVVIEHNNQVLIYDTGAAYNGGFNMVDAVLSPYLKFRGYQSIEYLIISHKDNDHAGGYQKLSEQLFINNLMFNQKNSGSCIAGQIYQWQALRLEVLHPKVSSSDKNDDSCVVKVSDGQYSLLLTGDISAKVEKMLVKQYADKLSTDILILPHHGSKTSSTYDFIKTVKPQHAIVSAGFNNRWGMPNKNVVERFENFGLQLINTGDYGMIKLNITEEKITDARYRQDIWPFWFAN